MSRKSQSFHLIGFKSWTLPADYHMGNSVGHMAHEHFRISYVQTRDFGNDFVFELEITR